MRVAAVVVTYNRKELLMECLEALLRQTRPLQAIYIIDNASTDGTPELLHRMGYTPSPQGGTLTLETPGNQEKVKIIHIRLPENTGGAGGFHEGVKRAYNDGYDWIWLMDDDAEPLEDALEKLLPYASDEVAALANLKVSPDGTPQFGHRGFFNFESPKLVIPINAEDLRKDCLQIDHSSFVGILVNYKSIKIAGFPEKKFFLHFDDVEYCARLRRVGKIILVTSSMIFHKEEAKKNKKRKKILWVKIPITPYKNLWLSYYGIRNKTWILKNRSGWKFYVFFLRSILLSIVAQIISGEKISKRIRFILNAYIDGFNGEFDNEKPRKILYG